MDTIEESAPIRRRRRHSAEFKAKAVQECMQPGVSIAAIALHHRLNANLLRRWVAETHPEMLARFVLMTGSAVDLGQEVDLLPLSQVVLDKPLNRTTLLQQLEKARLAARS